MSPQVLYAIISLIDRAASSAQALRAIKDTIEQKKAAGQEVTLDDLKQYEVADDKARDALVQAIEDAEDQSPG